MALTLHGTVSDNTVALDRKTATPLIINGDMVIAQRGNLTGISSSDNYVTDNFFTTVSSLGTFSISQDTDVPTGQGFRKSLKLDCTTAGSVDGAGDYIAFQKRIESQDLQLLKKGTSSAEYVTIAFWVKSTVTGTATLEIEDENSRTISQTYTISSANTWEKKVLSFVGDTSGALGNDNEKGITLIWWLGAGTTFTSGTLNTSWNAQNNANRVSSSNINIASSTDNNFYVTGVQLEVGQFDSNSIPAFQFEDVSTSLARCQRYFVTTYNEGVVPGTNGSKHGAIFVYRQRDNNYAGFNFQFPVGMRTIPAQVRYSLDGTSGQATASTTNFTSSTNHAINGTSSVVAYGTGTAADDCYQHFTCDAEL